MSYSRCLMTAALVGLVFGSAACTDKAVNDTKRDANTALDATRAGADKVIDATKKAGDETVDATKEAASATGAAVTDGWITTKVKAKFADEIVLKASDIHVETNDHVVTLMGRVPSAAATARAVEIARGTEGVTRVANQLVVQEKP